MFIWVRYTDHSTYCCQMWNNYYEYHGMTTAHYETWTSYVSSHFGISKTTHCSRCETWTKCFWYFSFVSSRIFIAIPVWFNCYCFDHLFLVLLQIDDGRSFWLVLIKKRNVYMINVFKSCNHDCVCDRLLVCCWFIVSNVVFYIFFDN